MNNKFFSTFTPVLNTIDNGSFFKNPFKWLYIIFAVLNLLLPLFVLYTAIDNNVFQAPARFSIAFILIWLVMAAAGWISFQIWWNRKDKVMEASRENAAFIATPVFAHLIQTGGEWLGTWLAIVGSLSSLFLTLILGSNARQLVYAMGLDILNTGPLFIVLWPILGYILIILSRFISEQARALTTIANNTAR
ncbi:MAG TPA: hypothetical protein VKS21_09450 [Spirochaetota bacterium]|nr:hypothetical protein [Spirochaetota bacterium]